MYRQHLLNCCLNMKNKKMLPLSVQKTIAYSYMLCNGYSDSVGESEKPLPNRIGNDHLDHGYKTVAKPLPKV